MPSRLSVADGVLSLLLFAAAVAYLISLRQNLGLADEAYFLYEAKRIRDGEVMYRDVFQYVTPLASYGMAAVFWLFGTTMGSARAAMAVVHATTGVLLYVTARRLGVRRALAATGPFAYLAICQSAWPYASWHWFATLVTMALCLVLVAAPWQRRPRWALLPGIVSGILIGVQQQKGVIITAGVGALLLADHFVERRYGGEPVRLTFLRVAYFAAGLLIVCAPLTAVFVAAAGARPLYDALVRFPLASYHSSYRVGWGHVSLLTAGYAQYTFPALLRYAPLAAALPLAAAGVDLMRARQPERVRNLLAVAVVAAASTLSIWYFPDVIHLAFIAPALWLCAAAGGEWLLSALPGPARPWRVAAAVGSAVLVLASARHLEGFAQRLELQFPLAHDTAFGRVDFAAGWEVALVDRVRDLLGQSPTGELFCYPSLAAPYLTTGGRNPTPFQHFDAAVFPAQYTEAVLATLQKQRVPYVITAPFFIQRDDPILRLLNEQYDFVSVPNSGTDELPTLWLYGRKDLVPAATPASAG